MKKRILIIGNNSGLQGVNVDVKNYHHFFRSSMGGSWEDYEIEKKLNPRKIDLQVELLILKNMALDYLIVIFSGHGGQKRETVLELNSSGETINDTELQNIAKRQLNIYDCCRSYPEDLSENVRFSNLLKSMAYQNTRARYEARIMQAIHQQASLYSCSIGGVSWDTSDGGIYSNELIKSARTIYSGEYKLVGEAHTEAAEKTKELTKYKSEQQKPDSVLLRCLSPQQLIIGINP
jgi:hypothetical protein